MGQIYKAHDPDIHRPVAIKLISTRLMSSADRADYIRRFRREAQAAARCAHPNIVAIYDYALHEGQPFLAMEFVHGMSLRHMLDEQHLLAVPDAIRVMLQVLDALDVAHRQGVIHQDIKPANIMLTPQMQAKVTDFGISRLANTEITIVSSSMGTPNYMSPEQCRGGVVDRRADLFSVGATLFEMVAGERSFSGHTTAEVTYRILNESLPLLPVAVRGAAPRLQFVLERALSKQPDDRFDSSTEMAEALRQILQTSRSSGSLEEETRLSSLDAAATRLVAETAQPPPTELPRGTPTGSSIGAPIDAGMLLGLEQKLAGYVGPIARIMVRNIADRAASLDALCRELADSVPEGREREGFRRDVATLMKGWAVESARASSEPPSGQTLSEADLEHVQAALTQHVGPIARVLVRRAAREAGSVEALWQSLAAHVDSPTERAAFLRQRHVDRT
ncbi:MAG: serine/threonine-protein kinase [Reyranella sp.]